MRWLLATVIVLLCSAESRAQCYYDVRYTHCPPVVRPWESLPHYGRDIPRIPRLPAIGRQQYQSSQQMMNDTRLLEYWLKRSHSR
jgi:hypothetical protein